MNEMEFFIFSLAAAGFALPALTSHKVEKLEKQIEQLEERYRK
ncbi:hypothetical protein [Alkalicoccus daliensis]|uniref:Uncharacterized protein n=1 Tax=Alkalicoccus daliensis TaxID=745820 RepID=A0A1H0HT93_9BACI|nr:hypothetical protein [Alkalicoccus daliensis]SDO22334.1 hypothetical protein SAMN04488053_10930 [Alkalicoccus daliensis]